jgi:probable rRNA maturation factor
MARKSTERLSLAVQYACDHKSLPTRPQVRRWVLAASKTPVRLTVRFVDGDEGKRLNREFRNKRHATNVLSFVYERTPVVGDLVLCVPVVLKEAREQGKTPVSHFAHLIVHGMLHLQGYDHEAGKQEAARMEAMEREILSRFGIADPY